MALIIQIFHNSNKIVIPDIQHHIMICFTNDENEDLSMVFLTQDELSQAIHDFHGKRMSKLKSDDHKDEE